MVHIRSSETNKVTVEYTLEELSLVENDLMLYSSDPDERPSQATQEFLHQVAKFWDGGQRRG